MKLKKGIVRLFVFIILVVIAISGFHIYNKYIKKSNNKVRVIDKISSYDYSLKETKNLKYKKMFGELKTILSADSVDEKKYAEKISEMFIYDFYSLKDKVAKTDVGGVDFIYPDIRNNFIENAQNTYYKYVESNLYGERKQLLPEATNISIDSIENEEFAYGDLTDEKAYTIEITWTYTNKKFSSYQKKAKLILIHKEKKLYIVELQ